MLNHIMHSNQQVVTHPVEHLTADDIASLPELPMMQADDGTWYCDGESTQETTKGYQLFDKSTAQDGFIKSDGTVESVTWIKHTDYIKVSGSYVCMHHCISTTGALGYIAFYDSEKNFMSGSVQLVDEKNPDNPVTVDIPENAVYFRCNVQTDLLDTAIITVDYVPAEMEYEPYTGGKPSPNHDYPSPITNTYPAGTYKAICGDKVYKVVLDDDLRSVPNYADRVVIDTGRGLMWVERKVNSAEFDGSDDENWWQYIDSNGFIISIDSMVIGNRSNAYCSHFTNSNKEISGVYEQGFWSGVGNNRFYIIEVSELATTVDEWKSWLSSNPVTVHYILATPTTHQSIPTQLVTISTGKSAQILNTVNDKADFLKVRGDSWQLVQDEIVDEDGNVTQPAIPSPEYPSEIKDVGGTLRSSGWNYYSGSDIEGTQNNNSGIIQTIQPGTYTFMADVESSDTDNTKCFILFYNGTTMLNGVIISRGKGAQTTVTLSDYVTKFTCYASNSNLNSLGDTFSFRNIQITKGDTTRPYDRHRGNSITLPTLRGLPDGTRDVLYVDRKARRAWVERKVGLVESYNGESVGDLFMSNTGELSTGAVVHYKLATPVTEELPYSDYLLDTCQWETNLFVDCDSHLVPEIEIGCKILGR